MAHFERFFKIFHLRSRGQPWRLSFSFFLTLMLKLSLKKYNMNGVEILPFDKKDCARLFFNIFINTKNHVRWALFLLLFQPISIDFKSDRGWIMLKSTSTQTGKINSSYLTYNYFTFNTLKALKKNTTQESVTISGCPQNMFYQLNKYTLLLTMWKNNEIKRLGVSNLWANTINGRSINDMFHKRAYNPRACSICYNYDELLFFLHIISFSFFLLLFPYSFFRRARN